jgi:HAD superfamily hydrolase (TIGR01490 family)
MAPAQPLKLTLFDLDGTLLAGDSDMLWCAFLQRHGILDPAEFGPHNAAIQAEYRAGTVGIRAFCDFYIGTLAGRSAAEWEVLRQQFLYECIVPAIPAAAWTLVRRHQADGDLVVLTTATNRFLTELTCAHLGIAHLIATECEVGADGRFNGRTAGTPNMREGKLERLHGWLAGHGLALADCDSRFYSDSINDLPLLAAVRHPVAVDPDERLREQAAARGWPVINLR